MASRKLLRFGLAVLSLGAGSTASSAAGFDQSLSLQGITFHVTCPNDSSAPTVTITPSGLAIDNSPMTKEVDGHVVGAEVADLNVDGSPEIYVYRDGDTNAKPTGGTRQIQYKLAKGEASWLLRADKVVEY